MRGLAEWYDSYGRHQLPWRASRDPWLVLVSEVMLQQTPVGRVLPRWARFVERWPTPHDLSATPLEAVLVEWKGLGYPRRARALWEAAALISQNGWPATEAGLRALPGIGPYTARALLALAFEQEGPLPRDVNIGRVVDRVAGVDALSHVEMASQKPAHMSQRDYVLALFDVGTAYCGSRPHCASCPLVECRSRGKEEIPAGSAVRRQAAYRGSLRELRGRLLAWWLEDLAHHDGAAALLAFGDEEVARVELAWKGLIHDGLVATHSPPIQTGYALEHSV